VPTSFAKRRRGGQESRKFRLSHRAPVDLPLETSASLDARFLNRNSVNQQKPWGFHSRIFGGKNGS